MSRFAGCLSLILAVATLAGCGGGDAPPANRDPVFPVKGKITYKGRPVTNADVTFVCKEKDRSAFGKTDNEGQFELTTFASNDGAVAGKHTVVVSKVENTETKPVAPIDSPDYAPPSSEDVARMSRAVKNTLPKKYADVKSSDLIAVVNEDGSNAEMTLELKD